MRNFYQNDLKCKRFWDFLVLQWLRLPACMAGSVGSIPGWGTKIQHVAGSKQKLKVSILEVVSFSSSEDVTFTKLHISGKVSK